MSTLAETVQKLVVSAFRFPWALIIVALVLGPWAAAWAVPAVHPG